MWIVTNKGMLSIVQDEKNDCVVKVRARNKEAFEGYFPEKNIIVTPDADYRFRVIITRDACAKFVEHLQKNITYPNFKDSIEDPDLKRAATEIWVSGYRMQEKKYPPKRKPLNPSNSVWTTRKKSKSKGRAQNVMNYTDGGWRNRDFELEATTGSSLFDDFDYKY